jgi:Holliday junction resolvasome RuvABC endonuclease subunit
MKIIALDIAQKCGFAIGLDGELVASGFEDFTPKRGDSLGMRWIVFRQKFGELCDEQRPDLVVFEQAFIGAMRSKHVAEWALGFRALVQEECDRRGIEYREVHNTQVKLHATGLGNADKLAMQAAACAKWPAYDPSKDKGADEADACWLLSYAMAGFPVLETQAAKAKRVKAERKQREIELSAGFRH